MLDVCETHEANAAARFYRQLSGSPWTASFRGHVFERQVLNHLCGIRTEYTFLIRGLTDSNETTWTYRGEIPRVTYQESAEFKKAVAAKRAVHLVPSATNFQAVDSIIYHPDDVLTLVHVTMNSKHPTTVSGLGRIQRWFREVGTAGLLPTKKTRGVSYLLSRKIWRLLSNCQS